MRRVFDEWGDYERAVVPRAAGEAQREECRRAFYAGAWSLYWLVLAATSDRSDVQCEHNLAAIGTELHEITRDLHIARPHP